MKNIFKFSTLLAICSVFGLVACSPDELSTDQLADDGSVVFSAFAPNPIVRGAELRIVGSNLDKIVEVQIPGAAPITDISVVSTGRVSEIRVVTPRDGAEDESVSGPVVIIDNAGRTYTSKTDLSFTEGIVFDSFSPSEAMPGDEITVKGDYLYNVQQVVLSDGVYVTGDMITEKSRRELKFIVPPQAITGTFAIGDVDEQSNTAGAVPNNIVSTETLTIGDPTVRTADRGELKAGARVTVTGEYLNMIESLNFAGVEADFTVTEDAKSLTTALPATAVEGELTLVSYAGKEFSAGAYTTTVPTDVTIAAETRYKAGLNAVVSGNDLDLVTGASLAGTDLEYTYADGVITFAIPDVAVDGTVVLTLANGEIVETEAVELVKPTITGVTPASLYAGEENITVTGTDLDLAVSATLGGRAVTISEGATETSLSLETAATSVSGKVALTLANGVVVESTEEVTVNYHSLVIVTEMPAGQHIGQEVVIKGQNMSLIENIFIGEEKVTQYSLRTDEEVRFLMPWNKVGMYDVNFHLFNGDIETQAAQIEVMLELDIQTIWEGSQFIDAWSGNQELAWGGYDFSAVKAGDIITVYYTLTDGRVAQLKLGRGSDWTVLPGWSTLAGGKEYVTLPDGSTYISHVLTAEDANDLKNNNGMIFQGDGAFTVTKIEIAHQISQEVTIWEGEADPRGGVNLELGSADGADWRNANLQAGQTINIYFTVTDPTNWWIQMFGPHWGDKFTFNDVVGTQFNQDNTDGSAGVVSFVVTESIQSVLTESQNWGSSFILQGEGLIYTKVTLL